MNKFSNGFPANQADAPVTGAPIQQLSGSSSEGSLPVPRVLVTCSSCKATLSVKRVFVGSAIQCKQCGQILTVPADGDTQPMPVVGRPFGDLPSRPPQADFEARNQGTGVLDKVLLDQLAQFMAGSNGIRTAHDKLQAEHNELRSERDALAALLESVTGELNAIRADLGTIAPADVRFLASEREELRALVQRLGAEVESNRQAFDLAERSHLDERERLTADLAALRARHHDLEEKQQSTELLCKQLQDRNQELVAAQARRESEYDALLDAARTERQQLAEEVLALRENAEETARVAEQLISASLNSPAGPCASANDLEAVRVQAEELKYKLEEVNGLYRGMTETLHGMGIPI